MNTAQHGYIAPLKPRTVVIWGVKVHTSTFKENNLGNVTYCNILDLCGPRRLQGCCDSVLIGDSKVDVCVCDWIERLQQ
jgi:hypothetical protein